jgi:non-ribosomal peptide synthetase component F
MTGSGERAGDRDVEGAATWARLFLAAMRKHDRAAALLHHGQEKWQETPDWRLERQVIRLALFLRDRGGILPGDRVAIVSRLRPEAVAAELAALAQGAAALAIDPDLSPGELRMVFEQTAPAAVFVPDAAARGSLPSGARAVLCFDGSADGAWAWTEALDLGGTLDTPERAQLFRALAREVKADAPALGHLVGWDGSLRAQFLTQAETAARLVALRTGLPARKGAVGYVAGAPTAAARLALLSFIADGSTTCALGTPGREAAEVAELQPDWVVGPDGALESRRSAAPPAPAARRGLLDRVFESFRSNRRET